MPKQITPEFKEHLKRIGFKRGGDPRRNSGRKFTKGHKINLGRKYSEERNKKIKHDKQFKKGNIPWIKGKAKVKECKNCHKKFTGQNKVFCSDECRFQYTRGENTYLWKGGITPLNMQIRKSPEYKLWRKSVFERDNYTCVWCGQKSRTLHADHIKPFALYPELRFAIDNGRTLCIDCHKKTDSYLRYTGKSRSYNERKI